jgi:signal transduction histidine kinase
VMAIAEQFRTASTVLPARLDDMRSMATKARVTGDDAYRRRYEAIALDVAADVRALQHDSAIPDARGAIATLAGAWTRASSASPGTVWLDSVMTAAGAVAIASDAALRRHLLESRGAAARATGLAWLLAIAAVASALTLAVLLTKAIVHPVQRLALASREIAAGRLATRVAPSPGGRDEISQVMRDFDAMAARLETLERAKKEFLSNVSHDLRAPLASMQETSEALLDGLGGPVTERQRRLLLLSRDSGQRLAAMIGKLLDLARYDIPAAGDRRFDLAALARAVIDECRAPREGRGIGVSYAPPHGELIVRGDAEAMARVITNLLENAVQVGSREIRVCLERRGQHVLLQVADDGPGIPASEREQIFERFHRGNAGRTGSARGMGLGLAICRQVVDAHGGRIWAQANSPRGALLSVLLPCEPPRQQAAESAA